MLEEIYSKFLQHGQIHRLRNTDLYDSSVVILRLIFRSSFMQCYTLSSSYLVGRVLKHRFIEFFVFDYGSLPYLPSLFFWLGMEWNMFFGPKAQHWDRQGHSAPKKRKKKEDRVRESIQQNYLRQQLAAS